MVTSLLCAIQYSLNSSTVALVICCIGIVRSVSALIGLKHPVFQTWPFLVLFLVAQGTAFVLTANWDNFVFTEALPVIGAFLGTIGVFAHRMAVTKSLMISSGMVWLTYQLSAGFYTQMFGEGFTLFANTFALVMILKAEKAGATEEDLKDIDAQVIEALTGSMPVIAMKEALTGSMPIVRVTTDTKPLPVISKVTVAKIDFPETGNFKTVTA